MLKLKAMTVYIGLCVVVGLIAKARGRSGLGWALLACVVTPLIAGALVLLLRVGNGPRHPLA